ncbi:FecR family protein [Pontibacter sp. SGAir0037]|uniref:FecR family protein n=1 Tax=Pontibacter sp. SGAir0037 TaxID=2571030 RepID=UPI0010CCB880|nr:FecR domain-containing protein [Pontibacter sp. SGAir0037]QCR24691.1 hypothetical protein C1N53_21605 [Pontibacter sp. SGAir0037]
MWKEEHFDLLLRYLQKNASEQETEEVEIWLKRNPENLEILEELEAHYQSVLLDQETYDVQEKGLGLLQKKLDLLEGQHQEHQSRQTPIQSVFSWRMAAVAAFMLLLISVGIFFYVYTSVEKQTASFASITKQTGKGQRSRLILPDGSTVYLNSESSLTYSSNYYETERTVYLQGEAFFEVIPDSEKPFRVETASFTTQVLGTSFNVQAYPHYTTTSVAVATGKVKVLDNTEQELVKLVPGQQLSYDHATHAYATETITPEEVISWTKGQLIFKNTPLDELISELERWYDISIELQNQELSNCRFTATFDNLTLNESLYLLSITTNLNYTQHGRTITISGKSCQ